jgi:hypothetical protein
MDISGAAEAGGGARAGGERWRPEDTPNPLLARFYSIMGKRLLDRQYEVGGGRE